MNLVIPVSQIDFIHLKQSFNLNFIYYLVAMKMIFVKFMSFEFVVIIFLSFIKSITVVSIFQNSISFLCLVDHQVFSSGFQFISSSFIQFVKLIMVMNDLKMYHMKQLLLSLLLKIRGQLIILYLKYGYLFFQSIL